MVINVDSDIRTRIYNVEQVTKGYVNNPDPKSVNKEFRTLS